MTNEELLQRLKSLEERCAELQGDKQALTLELNKFRLMQLEANAERLVRETASIYTMSLDQVIEYIDDCKKLTVRAMLRADELGKDVTRDRIRESLSDKNKKAQSETERIRNTAGLKTGAGKKEKLSESAKIIKTFVTNIGSSLDQTQMITMLKAMPMFKDWEDEKIRASLLEVYGWMARKKN